MDKYKVRIGAIAKKITIENFEADTLKRYPYYPPDGKAQYAVCPNCDNPIAIIGLYTFSSDKKPFGKHMPHAVAGIADSQFDEEDKANCFLFKPRKQYQQTDRKLKLDKLSEKALKLLINHFDQVIYILQKETGINFSKKLVTNMLQDYVANRGYLYSGIGPLNAPWTFAYMTNSHSLYRQFITDQGLIEAIKKEPIFTVSNKGQVEKTSAQFADIAFCFIKHIKKYDENTQEIIESMQMVVSTTTGSKIPKVIYEKTIDFNYFYFQSIMNLPEDRANRKQDLIDLAQDMLGYLIA